MRMIHCADLHLDSPMTTYLDRNKANERKQELLNGFIKMVEFAAANRVEVILIAGDMFDTKNVDRTTKNTVIYQIEKHPEIKFYYLKGNHDGDNFIDELIRVPDNLYLFDHQWKEYKEGENIRIYGIEQEENNPYIYDELHLDKTKINIVMLHGQDTETGSKDPHSINLRALENKGIDYLALGHIHSYREGDLDGRGKYVYPGCLCGRGFDECGPHGFVIINVDEVNHRVQSKFLPLDSRNLYQVYVDVSGCSTTIEMIDKVAGKLIAYPESALIKIVLKGNLDVECEKNLDYIQKTFESQFYFVKVTDETTLSLDLDKFAMDISLRGEFVRQVRKREDLDDNEKNIVIRYGLQILDGEKEVE